MLYAVPEFTMMMIIMMLMVVMMMTMLMIVLLVMIMTMMMLLTFVSSGGYPAAHDLLSRLSTLKSFQIFGQWRGGWMCSGHSSCVNHPMSSLETNQRTWGYDNPVQLELVLSDLVKVTAASDPRNPGSPVRRSAGSLHFSHWPWRRPQFAGTTVVEQLRCTTD